MSRQAKGYLLTYVGWFMGIIAAIGIGLYIFSSTAAQVGDNTTSVVAGATGLYVGGIFGLFFFLTALFLLPPMMCFILLYHTHKQSVATPLWLSLCTIFTVMLFIISYVVFQIYLLSVVMSFVWILLSPYLARRLATRNSLSKH